MNNHSTAEEMQARYERSRELYQEGQKLMMNSMQAVKNPLTMARNTTLLPVWIGDSDSFWYERQLKSGREYRVVDAKKGTNEPMSQ